MPAMCWRRRDTGPAGRAELFRAGVHARRGLRAEALRCARWAISELEAAAVYPGLILVARAVLALYGWTEPDVSAAVGEWATDLQAYLNHERVKSVVVDAVRYAKVLAEGSRGPEGERALIANLADKLAAGRAIWGLPEPVDPAHVEAVLRSW